MIRRILQLISNYPIVPTRTEETFYADMEAWVTHGANITVAQQNQLRNEINNTVDDINGVLDSISNNSSQIANDKTTVNQAKLDAQSARDSAIAANNAAQTIYDTFDDRYLGTKTTAPTVDNDGNALQSGALYFNSISGKLFIYDLVGAKWVDISTIPTLLSSLSDVAFTTKANNDVIQYDSATGKWVNRSFYSKAELDALINIHSKTAKTTLVDTDEFMVANSVNDFSLFKITWQDIKTALKSIFISKVTTPTTNALAKINADGTIGNSNINNDSNGNTGFGFIPSAWNSLIKSIQVGSGASFISPSVTELSLGSNYYRNLSDISTYIGIGQASKYSQSAGSHIWQTAPSGTAGNPITWAPAMAFSSGVFVVGDGGYNAYIMAKYDANNFTYIRSNYVSDTSEIYTNSVAGVKKSAILANGTFQSATNVYGSTSDIKLKENINDASPKLDKLMQVKIKTFNYKGQEEKQIGVVAQEIENLFPSIVFETKDTKQVEVEKEREKTLEDGTVEIEKYTEIETVETGETTKNVKYSVIYMMMLKGMQEQQIIIDDLKLRLKLLETKK